MKKLGWLAWAFLFSAWIPSHSFACTVITVAKKASSDGSVMTSHTVDSHRTASDVRVIARRKHKKGEMLQCTTRQDEDTWPMNRYVRRPTGKIHQVAETYGYFAPAYAPMNEHQLAMGESTFGGREELRSEKGVLDCETTQALMMQRAKTAREAILIAGTLLKKYGWIDTGEALSVVDKKEAWIMEIVGPGKGKVGAIWAAQRIPDDHVTVNANAARIGQIDPSDKDWFMASPNVKSASIEKGYWDPKSGQPFDFSAAYNPEGRMSFASTRREWRVLNFLAPSLKLHPNRNRFPFSVKPDKPVSAKRIMEIFRDTYEGTEYDMTAKFTITDEETGKTIKSPLANPFMPYDANKVYRIHGGWGWRGERPLARWYTMYAVITQSRSFLPDPIGGIVWFGYDNTAMTTYVPFYIGITDLPDDFKTSGRKTGFSRQSAWWAFNRVATLAAQRWGDMRVDVAAVRDPLQKAMLADIKSLDTQALALHKKNPGQARAYLTRYVSKKCAQVVKAYWSLGDRLWTQYDEKW
jgi:dipeptidase